MNCTMKKILASLFVSTAVSFTASANLNITAASGGTAISADTAATAPSPAWTSLGNIQLKENGNNKGDFGAGTDTLVLNAPSGFEFNTNSGAVAFAGGNNITGATLAVSPTSLSLSINVSGVNANDTLTISGLQVRPTQTSPLASGNITRGTSTGLAFGGNNNYGTLTEVAGAPTALAIQTQPGTNAAAVTPFAPQPVVRVVDQFGNTSLTNNSAVISATVNSGTGSLVGTTDVTAVNGVATYTDLGANASGVITILFSSGALTSVVSDPVDVTGPPTAAAIVIQTQPSANATAGVDFAQQPVLVINDQFGAAFTNDNSTVVTATRFDGAGTLQGTTTATAVNGVVTFTNLSHTVATNITIRFTSGLLSSATSSTIAVAPAAATTLTFTTQPSGAIAGLPFATQPVVTAYDAFGNVSAVGLGTSFNVTAALTLGAGPLSGTTSVDIGTSAGNGVAAFSNLSIATVDATNQLTVSGAGLTDAVSAIFSVAPQVPAQLVITTQPSSNAVAGVAFATQPVVQVRDSAGNLVSSDNTTVVHVARGTGSGALFGTVDVTAVNGVATFTDLSYNTAQTITLVFTSAGLTNATSDAITVTAAPADRLVFTTQPAGGYAGSAFLTQPVLVTRDAFGNNTAVGLASNQVVTVALTSGTGALIGTTNIDISTGSATFTDLGVTAAGQGKVITASSGSLTNAVSAAFNIGGVEPSTANVSADTSVSGFSVVPDFTYYEAQSGDIGTGIVSLAPPAGYEFVPGGTGGSEQDAIINKIGGGGSTGNINGGGNHQVIPLTVTATNISFTVTSTSSAGKTDSITWHNVRVRALTSSTAVSGSITKQAGATLSSVVDGTTSFATLQTVGGAVAQLVIQTQPSTNASVGVAFAQQPVIALLDQFGNPSSSAAVITATRNLGMADLQGTTNITAVNGIATFTNLSYNVAEAITINFSTGAVTPVTSDTIYVGAGTADHLVFSTQPGTGIAGVPLSTQPVVKTVDIYGNPTTGGLPANLFVSLSLTAGSGLAGTTMLDIGTAAGNGTVTFTDLQVNTPNASNVLTAVAVESGIAAAVSAPFIVTEAPAAILLVQGDGQNGTVGATLPTNPTVQVLDSNTNPIAGLTVTFNVTAGGGSVGSPSAITDVNGYASTTWTLGSTVGANTLVASTLGLSSNITFNATAASGAGAQLVITTQPSTNAVAGVAFTQQPVVEIRDQFGNLVTTDNTTVVTATRGTGTTALQGTTSVAAVGGVVTFSDLSYNTAETITIVFSTAGMTNATSDSIVVAPAAADHLAFTTQPAGGYAGSAFLTQPVVRTQDQYGNNSTVGLAASQIVTVELTAGTGSLVGTTNLDLGTAAGNGVAAFSDLAITAAGQGKVLTASSAGFTNGVSAAFNIGGVEPSVANVSADTAVSGFSIVPNFTYYEAQSGDVGVGTITLNAPAGFEFVPGGTQQQVVIQKIGGGSNTGNINGGGNHQVIPLTVTSSNISFTVTSTSTGGKTDSITWQNVRVRSLGGISSSGAITADASSPTLTSVTNGVTTFATLQTVAGALHHLVISTQPSTNAQVGVAFPQQPVIRLEDQFNNVLVGDDTTQVTATRNAGTSALVGTTTVTATNGYVTFTDLSYNVAEMITIDFSTGALPVVTSDAIFVGAGVADHLVFTVQPNGAVVGVPFGVQPVVRTADAYGNFTSGGLPTNLLVNITLGLGAGPLAGTTSVDIGTAAGNGTATFSNLQINTADPINTLVASASGLTGATSAVFAVTTADHLVYVSGDGQLGIVGNTLGTPLIVQVVDTNGAPVEGVLVNFAVTGGGGSVGSATVYSDTNGIASTTFTLGMTSGTSNNTVVASAFVPGNPNSYTFYASADPGIAAKLGVQTQPSTNAVAGVAFATQPVIRIEDVNGNLIAGDNTTVVTVARGTGTGTGATGLQGTLNVTAVNGIVTFTNLSYNKAEMINLVFTASGLTGTNSVNIVVDPATVTQLAFTTQPGSARTDSILNPQPVVKSEDQFGNPSTVGLASNLTVSVALTTGTGTLLGTTSLDIGTAAGNGVATFTNLQITAAGLNKQLTATASGLSNAVSATFIIGGVDPAIIPTVPANGSSVAATGPAYYELASGDVGIGTIILNAPVGYQFDTSSIPTVTIKRIGGNGGPVNNINGANNGGSGTTFPVTSFSATQIVFTVTNTSSNGVTDSITWNNIKVQAAVGIPTAQSFITKTGTSTMAAVVNGVTSFGQIIGDPRPVQIVIQTQPSSTASAGVAFAQQPVVLVEDQFGNLWTNTSVNVTAGIASGTGALQGTTTVASVNGVVTFTGLSYNVAETITLSFTSSGLVSATSSNIVVGVGPATSLVFSTQPGGAVLGNALNPQPVVKTVDAFGNNSTVGLGTNVTVTLTLTSGTGSLVGTAVANIGTAGGNGTATFSGLTVDAAGVKQLTASASGLSNAVSATFTIGKASQTITFGSLSDKATNDAPFTVNATASSGLAVTFSIFSGPATISGNTVTLTGATGTVVVRASQAGDANYNAAADVDQSFNVLAGVAAPVITNQPVSQSVVVGSSVSFSVGATGTSLSYQWLVNGTNIAGANGSSLVINPVHLGDAGVYSVVVSNSAGIAVSSNATLTVTTVTNDIDFDGNADLLLQSTNNEIALWNLDGTNFVSSLFLNDGVPLTSGWRLAAQGDFNHDGQTDLVFQNGGIVTIWLMEGTNMTSSIQVNPSAFNKAWKVVGARDFNHDGNVDVLLQHDQGYLSVWLMNGTSKTKSFLLRNGIQVPPSWKIVGLNDFDGDGNIDYLWQNNNGKLAIWYMNGTKFKNGTPFGTGLLPSEGWRIVGMVDLNADGKRDVLWQNTDGRLFVWFMDGTNVTGSNFLLDGSALPAGWKVVAEK